MKKKIIGLMAVLVIAAVSAWNLNFNSQMKGMSDIMLANVEALADDESEGGVKLPCTSTGEKCVYDCIVDGITYKCTTYGFKNI